MDSAKRKYGASISTATLDVRGRAVKARVNLCETIVEEIHGVCFTEAVSIHNVAKGRLSASPTEVVNEPTEMQNEPLYSVHLALRLHYLVNFMREQLFPYCCFILCSVE